MIWFDDNLPQNAIPGGTEGWNWLNHNPAHLLGNVAHQSLLKNGLHDHFFEKSALKLTSARRPKGVVFGIAKSAIGQIICFGKLAEHDSFIFAGSLSGSPFEKFS
jgi:hypothetical protein